MRTVCILGLLALAAVLDRIIIDGSFRGAAWTAALRGHRWLEKPIGADGGDEIRAQPSCTRVRYVPEALLGVTLWKREGRFRVPSRSPAGDLE
jgi:hypothetical protein